MTETQQAMTEMQPTTMTETQPTIMTEEVINPPPCQSKAKPKDVDIRPDGFMPIASLPLKVPSRIAKHCEQVM